MSKRGGQIRLQRRTDPLLQLTLGELRARVAELELDNFRADQRAETAEIAERCADARARYTARCNARLQRQHANDRGRMLRLIRALRAAKRVLLASENDAHVSMEKRAPIAAEQRQPAGAAA